jgi:hypothetical protein
VFEQHWKPILAEMDAAQPELPNRHARRAARARGLKVVA